MIPCTVIDADRVVVLRAARVIRTRGEAVPRHIVPEVQPYPATSTNELLYGATRPIRRAS